MNQSIQDHYETLFELHGDTHEAAQYSSRESQFRRFASLARIGNMKDQRVLDYGCGTGCFAEYLQQINQEPSLYCGVDIVEEFLACARLKWPKSLFLDPSSLGEMRFDYAFVSGVFNNRSVHNRKFWQETVRDLFHRSDKGVAFNLMSTYVDYRDPDLFYEDPCRAFRFVKREITPFVQLCHDYLVKEDSIPFEFTLFAYRSGAQLNF
jgi:SAM-dependent methyltransferase